MVSVICCYNKVTEYAAMSESLKTQTIPYELIGVDNSNSRFSSAAAALNWGAMQSNGDTFVFLHQDIVFCQEDALAQLVSVILQTPNPVIAGLFGAKHTQEDAHVGEFNTYETLDECCIAMSRETWSMLRFNETLCDGWHLYAVELCLRAQNAGVLICAKDCGIRHMSNGTVDKKYMKTFRKLMLAYPDKKWIATTCKSMPNNMLYYYGYYAMWVIKKCMLGNYPLIYRLRTGRK